ncbi:MAG: DUF523 domain-containing protein [Halobacteriovoraceae bacterium]|jgi:uncharacterized protein YbbK (DUF523 family)|nr:DUF523 domain-containing protein [Halobacteriovoraceae bacterium]
MKKIIISKCLLGEKVRYDGGHCSLRGDYLARLKNKYELIPICPEVASGLGTPRDPIEFTDGDIVSLAGENITAKFNPVMEELEHIIKRDKIKMAIMKEKSPSCGVNYIYDGTFSGKITEGSGLITSLFKRLGVEVYSEEDVAKILNK